MGNNPIEDFVRVDDVYFHMPAVEKYMTTFQKMINVLSTHTYNVNFQIICKMGFLGHRAVSGVTGWIALLKKRH